MAAGFTFSSKTGEDCGAATHRWDGRRRGQHTVGAARGRGGGRDKKTTLEGDVRAGGTCGHMERNGPHGDRQTWDVGRADACSRRTQDTQTHTLLAWMAGGAHSDRVGVEHPPQTPQQTRSHLPLSRLKHAHQFYSRHTGS